MAEGRECDALMPERIKQQCDGSILFPVTHLTRHLPGKQRGEIRSEEFAPIIMSPVALSRRDLTRMAGRIAFWLLIGRCDSTAVQVDYID